MAYIINKFNGTQLLSVEDGTVDNTTDIKFVGKNYSGYGEIQNENYLFLLENFSGTVAPTKAISGQIWFDASLNKLKFYTGNQWKNTGGAEVSSSAPSGLTVGDFWFNNETNQVYARTSQDDFVLVGPQAAGSGQTQMRSIEVVDTGSVTKPVIVALVNDNVQFIISDEEFTLKSTQDSNVPVGVNSSNFQKIKKGITLINTDTNGITTNAGNANEPVIWATTSDTLRLGGIPAADYITVNETDFTSLVTFDDVGLRVGDSNDLAVRVVDGNVGYIENTVGEEVRLGAKLNTDVSATVIAKVINNNERKGILPGATDSYTLGIETNKWNAVWANNFKGIADKADTVKLGASYVSATTASSANTVVARDADQKVYAVEFVGVASRARYADLAEKYTTNEELAPGTAVAVCSDTDHEVGPANSSSIAIGVVSTDPAYMMNSEAEGQYIGLKGRLPVRVKGAVKKGQGVYAWEDGVCTTVQTNAFIGVALESNEAEEEKLVECVLKT